MISHDKLTRLVLALAAVALVLLVLHLTNAFALTYSWPVGLIVAIVVLVLLLR